MDAQEILDKPKDQWTLEELNFIQGIAISALSHPEVKHKIVLTRDTRAYFKKEYADQLAPIIDEMMEDKIEREFPYQDFYENNGWAKETLYLYVQQALDFLAACCDPKYKQFKDSVKLTKRKDDTGVRILWAKDRKNGIFSAVKKVKDQEKLQEWREPLFNWLGDPDCKEKAITFNELSLRGEEITFIRNLIENEENNGRFIILKLEQNEFKIGRL